MPKSTEAMVVFPMKRPDSFVALAERGLFVYDWQDIHRTRGEASGNYEQVAVPQAPAMIDALPGPLAALARQAALADVDFGEHRSVSISKAPSFPSRNND